MRRVRDGAREGLLAGVGVFRVYGIQAGGAVRLKTTAAVACVTILPACGGGRSVTIIQNTTGDAIYCSLSSQPATPSHLRIQPGATLSSDLHAPSANCIDKNGNPLPWLVQHFTIEPSLTERVDSLLR